VCGSSDLSNAFSVGDLNQGTSSEKFRYDRCAECGALFVAAVPADLGRYYGSGYLPYQARDSALFERTVAAERPKLDIVSGVAHGRTLLEIGAAAGAFAVLAKRNGFEVTAVEMDAESCAFMRTQGITAVETSDVVQAVSTLPAFDVIAMWHSIEHLPNPAEAFRALAGRLRPGGVLVIAAPNPGSAEFRLFGRHWVHVDAPRHLALIPRSALDRLARSVGLSPAAPRHRFHYDRQFESYWWFMRSYYNCMPPWVKSRFLLRVPLRLLSYPLYALLSLFRGREGNTYTRVLARDQSEAPAAPPAEAAPC
jgi:2-polyprenyl-3-methyl-5-hydroxy-6-metoxy-1,4-benzoquinol methylase